MLWLEPEDQQLLVPNANCGRDRGATLDQYFVAVATAVHARRELLHVTPCGHDLTDIKLRIDGIDLRIGGEQPLTLAGGEAFVSQLSTPPRTHSPHSEWESGALSAAATDAADGGATSRFQRTPAGVPVHSLSSAVAGR